jgi:hypothetical protein
MSSGVYSIVFNALAIFKLKTRKAEGKRTKPNTSIRFILSDRAILCHLSTFKTLLQLKRLQARQQNKAWAIGHFVSFVYHPIQAQIVYDVTNEVHDFYFWRGEGKKPSAESEQLNER